MTPDRSTSQPFTPRHPVWRGVRAAALATAECRGMAVFPTTAVKTPALPTAHPDAQTVCRGECGQLGHGVHDATADPRRVRALFAATQGVHGYGIACGRAPHHLIGLDLDRKNGLDGVAALADLAARHGFTVPDTITVATPSGGLHLWFTAPAGARVTNSASRLGPGIDVRGTGGYVIGPGSRTDFGRYAYLEPGPLAAVPAPLLDLMLRPQPAAQRLATRVRRAGSGEVGALAGFVRNAPKGQLNNRLYWASCRAFADPRIDPDTAADELLAAAVEAGHPAPGARRTIASGRRTAGAGERP
ncbi:bifunctional DNA primase/polymerase [Embleya sp. NPDC050154]|uniref:bifunctional DNA primase/polymerase n=1 Tax=Embleya sp. NPDC050154 TaxID=3363988 RepID=UPI0037AC9B26